MPKLVITLIAACLGFGVYQWFNLASDEEAAFHESEIAVEMIEEASRHRHEEGLTHHFNVRSGEKLSLDLKTGGDIHIEGWPENRVEVEVHGDVDAGDLVFEQSAVGVRVRTREGRVGSKGEAEYHVRVPHAYNVEIETMGGDIQIREVEGRFSGRTMGGDLRLEGLKGEVNLTTMGGDIKVANSTLEGRVHTMGGDVRLEDVSGEIDATTMGGDILRAGAAPDHPAAGNDVVHISSMGGDIKLDEAPAGADLHTMGGTIRVGHAGGFVKAKTMGGNIELKAVDGWVEAITMGGDVRVTMVGDPASGDRHVTLTSLGGDVVLTVPAGLSMDVDAEIAFTRGREGHYRVESDFDLKRSVSDEWERRDGDLRKYLRATGRVEGGRNRVKISTINGNIFLKRSDL